MKTIIAVFACLFLFCFQDKSHEQHDKREVRTKGIYICYNPYAQVVKDLSSFKAVDGKESLFIIRFLDQQSGIIIPDIISKSEGFTKDKVSKLYSWCQEYEQKNPDDKAFVHFRLDPARGDSIRFVRRQGGIRTEFEGINESDSLVLDYTIALDDKDKKIMPMNRRLVFRFYPI